MGKFSEDFKAFIMKGNIVDMASVTGEEDIMLITSDGTIIRTEVGQIRSMGRSTKGVRVMRIKDGVNVVAVATAPHEEEKPEDAELISENTEVTENNNIETL